MSQGVVLFTASIRSRQEIEALAAEARRLRSDVKISIRAAQGQGVIRGSWSSICRNRRCDLRGGGGGSGKNYRRAPVSTKSTLRLPHCEHLSRLTQSMTGSSAP